MTQNVGVESEAAGKAFARYRFQWLDQLACDRSLKASTFKLAYVLGGYVNQKTGAAWPSQKRLAAHLGTSRRAVQLGLKDLISRGYLEVVSGREAHRVNHYRPKLKRESATTSSEGATTIPPPAITDHREANVLSPMDSSSPAKKCSLGDESAFAHGRTPVRTEQYKEPLKDLTEHQGTTIVPASTPSSLLSLGPGHEKEDNKEKLKKISSTLGMPLTEKRLKRWPDELRELERDGFDFRRHLLPAVRDARAFGLNNGRELQITSLRYFRAAAQKFREDHELVGDARWDSLIEMMDRAWDEWIAARQTATRPDGDADHPCRG